MKKLSSRETTILIMTLVLMLVFIIFQFVIKPMSENAVDINDQMRLTYAHLIKARQMAAVKQEVEARYQNLVDVIGLAGSQGSQMTAMISKIESAAHETNVHIVNIQPQKTVDQKEVQFFPVELQIDGQWVDIVRFFNVLQLKPDLYFIDELNLDKYSDAANSLRGRVVVSCMRLVTP